MDIIERFYNAFDQLDAEGMSACYHDDATFEDPAFGKLNCKMACKMWHMLCRSQKGKGLKVTVSDIQYGVDSAQARWEAHYTFSKTGRAVHNIIHANFKLKDDLIIEHKDHFDLYRWSKQAFGLTGFLIGWSPFFRKKLQQQTYGLLMNYNPKK